jgi:curved DNA-binding protein CbpA
VTPKLVDDSPQAVEGLDIRTLPIGQLEARVLSYVNGFLTREQIAAAMGLGAAEVSRVLERLAELGAVRFESAQSTLPIERRSPPGTSRSGAYRIDAPRQAPVSEPARPIHTAPIGATPTLDPNWQRRVLALHDSLDVKNHYELLGIERDADDARIRASYRDVVRTFHPDLYFGQSLGELGPKLLRVFSRLTSAYEVLSRSESRAVYDRSLSVRSQIHTEPPGRRSSTSSLRPAVMNPADIEQRKRALARKLGVSSLPPGPASAPPAAQSQSQAPNPSSAPPPSRFENQNRLRNQQLEHYVGLADAAAAKNDLVSACNFLKLACSLAPQDLALAERLKLLGQRSANEHWETYAERGQQEGLDGEWAAAARSYERAAQGHPHPTLFERVAFCLLHAKGDLKRASEFAQRAVFLAPQNVRCRLTLARCYAATKQRANALAELEQARQLAPELPEIRDWIRRVQAGEA